MSTRPKGLVLWITGLPASGKTTLADLLLKAFEEHGVVTIWLDSDDLRRVITPNATYSSEERDDFYAAVGHLAALSAQGGAIAVVSATAPKRMHRDQVRALVPDFHEIYLYCAEYIRRARDIKGLYAMQDAGLISNLPGAGIGYEAPLTPELRFDSGTLEPKEITQGVWGYLQALGRWPAPQLS